MEWVRTRASRVRKRVDAEVERLCGANVGKRAGTLAGILKSASRVRVAFAGCSRGA
jgi:hypothetical protein